MDQIVAELLSWPRPVIFGIFGALGGVVGLLLSGLFRRLFKTEKHTKLIAAVVTLLFVFIFIQLANRLLPVLEKSFGSVVVVNELKQQRIFQVIFRLHPEAEAELAMKMKEILQTAPDDQVSMLTQGAAEEMLQKYFTMHLPSASDEVTHKLITHQLIVMKQFEDRPSLCVSYYLGKPSLTKNDVTPAFIESESNIKADVIESSISNPSLPPKAASLDALLEELGNAYVQKGYQVEDFAKLEQVETLPASEGCGAAEKFVDVLASLPTDRVAYIFKNLLYLSREQPTKGGDDKPI